MKPIRQLGYALAILLFGVVVSLGSPAVSVASSHARRSDPDRVEARIKELHSKLKITEAQGAQWDKVTQAMRENAATMGPMEKAWKGRKKMNAVEDLKAYSEMIDTQAAGLKSFIAAFEPLYAGMSDEQKKNADEVLTKRLQKTLRKK